MFPRRTLTVLVSAAVITQAAVATAARIGASLHATSPSAALVLFGTAVGFFHRHTE